MHDFVAEDMFNFVIKAGTGLYFYETNYNLDQRGLLCEWRGFCLIT